MKERKLDGKIYRYTHLLSLFLTSLLMTYKQNPPTHPSAQTHTHTYLHTLSLQHIQKVLSRSLQNARLHHILLKVLLPLAYSIGFQSPWENLFPPSFGRLRTSARDTKFFPPLFFCLKSFFLLLCFARFLHFQSGKIDFFLSPGQL